MLILLTQLHVSLIVGISSVSSPVLRLVLVREPGAAVSSCFVAVRESSLEAGGGKLLWLAWTMYSNMLPTYDVFAADQRCLICTLKPALTSARRTLLMLCDVIYV